MHSFAIVGLGSRSESFYKAICGKYSQTSRIVGICDTNPGRLDYARRTIEKAFPACRTYAAEQFDRMLQEQKPDVVIVCTVDRYHDTYICRSLENGCDVITEKPMTIDEVRCQRIIDTVRRTGRSVRVTFNYRYAPARLQVKDLLMKGTIGRILSVSFQWNLDLSHGADYFRRWHRYKENSGGLLVHKATHHFDLVNWFLGSMPQTVYAQGSRSFYTPEQAARYGLTRRGGRCCECPEKKRCNFFLDLSAYDSMRKLYLEAEKWDGYWRDRCIFDDGIDIEDTLAVNVRYQSGAVLSYCLNAFQPWEGYRIEINGTRGRLEHRCRESSYVNGDGTVQGAALRDGTSITVFPHFKTPYDVPIVEARGGHGGGDDLMLEDLFGQIHDDPCGRAADYVQGAASILVGIAGNKSIREKRPVEVADLVRGLPDPGYKPNRGQDDPIEFVSDVKYKHVMGLEG